MKTAQLHPHKRLFSTCCATEVHLQHKLVRHTSVTGLLCQHVVMGKQGRMRSDLLEPCCAGSACPRTKATSLPCSSRGLAMQMAEGSKLEARVPETVVEKSAACLPLPRIYTTLNLSPGTGYVRTYNGFESMCGKLDASGQYRTCQLQALHCLAGLQHALHDRCSLKSTHRTG
jgi:hypothetical protein